MEITTDILLRGTAWSKAISSLNSIFSSRTHYQIYMLSLAIGIMYDQRLEKSEENETDHQNPPSVPRNVLRNNDNGKLDFMFQAVILSTRTQDLLEDERLDLAFGEKNDFKKIDFLTQFANFGVTKLCELIGNSTLESMENIKNFLVSTVEGRNFDIDSISDNILFFDE